MKMVSAVTSWLLSATVLSVLLISAALPAKAAATWDLNDVSILYPLPKTVGSDSLLRTNSKGAKGELIPQRFFDRLPKLSSTFEDTSLRASLRVVSVRMDPCFPGAPTAMHIQGTCRRQIRLVWQPILMGSVVFTADVALHTFYELNDAEFVQLLAELQALKAANGSYPLNPTLGVHPILARQGLDGSFARGLQAILLKYAGDNNFSRVTLMQLTAMGRRWIFSGYDILQNQLQPMIIPRIEKSAQMITITTTPPEDFRDSQPIPTPQGADTFDFLLKDSSQITSSDAAAIRSSAQAIYRIENPQIHSPATIDCVSCHIAQPARSWALEHFKDLKLEDSPFRFRSALNLTNASPDQHMTNRLRAFGYFMNEVSISQRTINETAAVVSALNSTSSTPQLRGRK